MSSRRQSPRLSKTPPSQSAKKYDLAGKIDEISCPYPEHIYSCEPMRRRCVKAPNDCLTENLENYKRVQRKWVSPKRVSPKRRSSGRRNMKTIYPIIETHHPRPQSIEKAWNPKILADIRARANPLRYDFEFWGGPKLMPAPKTTRATKVKVASKRTASKSSY